MREIITYILLSEGDAERLTIKVQDCINLEDHQPFGAPFSVTFDDNSTIFYQAMVEYE